MNSFEKVAISFPYGTGNMRKYSFHNIESRRSVGSIKMTGKRDDFSANGEIAGTEFSIECKQGIGRAIFENRDYPIQLSKDSLDVGSPAGQCVFSWNKAKNHLIFRLSDREATPVPYSMNTGFTELLKVCLRILSLGLVSIDSRNNTSLLPPCIIEKPDCHEPFLVGLLICRMWICDQDFGLTS